MLDVVRIESGVVGGAVTITIRKVTNAGITKQEIMLTENDYTLFARTVCENLHLKPGQNAERSQYTEE